MPIPPSTLDEIIDLQGDRFYRLALVLAGDEQRAAQLLQLFVRRLAQVPPADLADATLLHTLLATAHDREQQVRRSQRKRLPRKTADLPPLYQSILNLPLEQRFALSLYLLLGYDLVRAAAASGTSVEQHRSTLVSAVRYVATAAGPSLTNRETTADCAAMRNLLVDPTSQRDHAPELRAHLATCSACRSFEHTWDTSLSEAEGALRDALRDQALPAAMETKLHSLAQGKARRISKPTLRFALPPLLVVALVAIFVVPGFLQRPTIVVRNDEEASSVDVQALLNQAVASIGQPPTVGNGVWHARWETLWYFDNDTYAPISAEAWIDQRNPARHRLQITHRDGGAPYELELGDGDKYLWYGLDNVYEPSLYGRTLNLVGEEPTLVTLGMVEAEQEQARKARLASGVWSIEANYLQQAQAASDVRTLGQQRDGDTIVQIISFVGTSPFSLPSRTGDASTKNITILLSLDNKTGRLRRAAELVGPASGTQTSRVTWRLVEESWLVTNNQIRPAFSIERAWTGVGEFPSRGRSTTAANPALPLLASDDILNPAALTRYDYTRTTWLPGTPPAGVTQALLYWPDWPDTSFLGTKSTFYVGTGRWLSITDLSNTGQRRDDKAEQLTLDNWQIDLSAGREQRYALYITKQVNQFPLSPVTYTLRLAIDAQGYSRTELLDVVQGLQQFDLATLLNQHELFATPQENDSSKVAEILVRALQPALERSEQPIVGWRERNYSYNADTPITLEDPYHYQSGSTNPSLAEFWQRNGDDPAIFRRVINPVTGADLLWQYQDAGRVWTYTEPTDSLEIWPAGGLAGPQPLTDGEMEALALLGARDVTTTLETDASGRRIITGSISIDDAQDTVAISSVVIDQLRPLTMTTELVLSPTEDFVTATRMYAEAVGGDSTAPPVLMYSWEYFDLDITSAPRALFTREPPAATMVFDDTQPVDSSKPTIHQVTLPEATVAITTPLFVLPEGASSFTFLSASVATDGQNNEGRGRFAFDAVEHGFAVQLIYKNMLPANSRLTLTQGEAGRLRQFLRTSYGATWERSEQRRVTVAGREVDAWLAEQEDKQWLFVEVDGTLLIVDAEGLSFDTGVPELLALLEPAL